jgi:hypothetical protein
MRRWIWVFVLVVGCDWRGMVSDTAARDHGCPRDQVRVLSDNGDAMARQVELDVCGSRRIYRDIGGRNRYLFVDTTTLTTGGEGERTVRPSGRAGSEEEREAALTARIEGSREREDGRRHARERARERERSAADARREGPAVVRSETAFDRTIRGRIDAARPGILACTGGTTAILARWVATDITVTLTARDADDATHGCVRAAIGDIYVDPSQPDGEVLHPVAAP